MKGLMMDFQLTLPTILKRAETYFPHQEIVTRMPDRSFHTLHVRRLRQAREAARGRAEGPRPRARRPRRDALLEPLPAPRGVPRHPVRRLRPAHAQPAPAPERPRLHRHARGRQGRDRRQGLLPLWEQFADKTPIEHVFVVEDSYEELLAGADPDDYEDPELDEDTAAAMCYTSGTTGMPKGVLYSHRSTVLHTLGAGARGAARPARDREGDVPARRADVPRERLGLPVHLPDGRREDRLPRPLPRPGDAARRLRAAGRDDHRRRADDLDGDPRHARRGARPLEPRRSSTRCSSAARRRRGR